MSAERYGDLPVYFSDVIVHSASPHYRLADLRGAIFAYNQAGSLSGYVLPRYRLLALGETLAFFQAFVESGSHARSMDWVEQGRVAAAAIDSVVLEMELRQHPARALSFRVVESIGPAPMPPVVASARLPALARAQLIAALSAMHTDPAGQAILDLGGVGRYAPVTAEQYAEIREILRAVEGVPA
jgi:phosphonate transport system substrate-binding protein